MITSANIVSYDGYNLIVRPHERIGRELAQKQVHEIELRIVDGRTISAEQRRKRSKRFHKLSDRFLFLPKYRNKRYSA